MNGLIATISDTTPSPLTAAPRSADREDLLPVNPGFDPSGGPRSRRLLL